MEAKSEVIIKFTGGLPYKIIIIDDLLLYQELTFLSTAILHQTLPNKNVFLLTCFNLTKKVTIITNLSNPNSSHVGEVIRNRRFQHSDFMNQRKQRKSLQEILKQRQQKSFVGREEQINFFRSNLALSLESDQRRFILSVFGQGGVGKTTLLKQFRKIASENNFATALSNDEETSVPKVMARLAQQFENQGHKLEKFSERYKVYRQKKQELESDPEAPQGFSAFLGQAVAKGGLRLAKEVPVAGAAMDFVDTDAFASQAGEWASFVAKRLTNKDEVRLVQEPLEVLTPLFLKEIGEIVDNSDIALFFDTYERTDDFLDSWLLDIFDGRYGNIPANILFIVAGRQELDKNHWANCEGLIARFPLEPFTEDEAREYLKQKGISDEQVIKVILELSGCFPLLVATLAAEVPQDPIQIGDSSGTAVERFLKWVDDDKRKEVALDAAIPLCINEDILVQLQGEEEGKALFNWLKEMPFVNERHDGWAYHDVVRTQMLRYKRRLSLQGWAELHGKLADYYHNLRNSLQLSEDKIWLDETWFIYTLEVTYHRLCESPHRYLSVALNEFLVALKNKPQFNQPQFNHRFVEKILKAGKDADSREVKHWGDKLVGGLKAFEEKHYEQALFMFTALVEFPEIEVKSRVVALSWRGFTYGLMKHYENALKDFDHAIGIESDNKLALAQRGYTYNRMNRYKDALQDFDRAIEIDPDYKWVQGARGYTYSKMRRYKDALKELDHAIVNEPYNIWALAHRGYTYIIMKRYKDALQDFDRAIEIDPDYKWAIVHRGQIHRKMGRYKDALKDLNHVIEIDANYTWALIQRGYTYRWMNQYEKAIKDFNRVIEIDPDYGWALARRGEYYLIVKQYYKALTDLNRAVELKDSSNWGLYLRALTYKALNQPDKAQTDLANAVKLRKLQYEENPQNWQNTLYLALYYLAADYIPTAKQLYELALSQNALPGYICMAIQDLDDFLTIFPEHKEAQAMRKLLDRKNG